MCNCKASTIYNTQVMPAGTHATRDGRESRATEATAAAERVTEKHMVVVSMHGGKGGVSGEGGSNGGGGLGSEGSGDVMQRERRGEGEGWWRLLKRRRGT